MLKTTLTGLILVLALGLFAQDIPIHWTALNNVNHDPVAHTIQKNVSGGGWNTWARSINEFDANEKAILNYTADVAPGGERGFIIALGKLIPTYSLSNVEYGFAITNTQVKCYYNGSVVQTYTRSGGGEELSLIRVKNGVGNWVMRYKINGVTINTESATPDLYYAYGLIRRNNATIAGLRATPIVSVKTTNYNCENSVDGSIDLTISGGVPPYLHNWSNGETTEDIAGLLPGVYSIIVTDDVGNTSSKNIRVWSDIHWTDEVNVATTPSSIVKNAGGIAENSGAASVNLLAANEKGIVSFRTSSASGVGFIGLSPANSGTALSSGQHGFIWFNTFYLVWNNGGFTSVGAASVGDKFKIKRDASGGLRYFVNGVMVDYYAGNIADAFIVDVNLYLENTSIDRLKVSFCSGPTLPSSVRYVELKDRLDGGYFTANAAEVKFTCRGEYHDQPSKYTIKDNTGIVVATETAAIIVNDKTGDNVNFEEGQGYYTIDVSGFSAGFYILETVNPKGEKAYLRFKV
jgi:hypothetical protein